LFAYIHDSKSDELQAWIDGAEKRITVADKEDTHSGEGDVLRAKLNRVTTVKIGCRNSSNGEPSTLCKDFVDQISTLLTKDSQGFIEEVVTELLLEEASDENSFKEV
jgi:hypothetical protein